MNYETKTVVSITNEEAKTIERAITLIEDLFPDEEEDNCYDFLIHIGHHLSEYYISDNERIVFKYEDDTRTRF